jgi:uncharacterized alkaline shock family protein YloU
MAGWRWPDGRGESMKPSDSSYPSETARTTIAPAVLLTIARLTVLGVPGVARLAPVPGGFDRLFRRGINEGIRVEINDSAVELELHLILSRESNALDVAHRVQAEVGRAVEETVGMPVSRIDVQIEDVEFGQPVG